MRSARRRAPARRTAARGKASRKVRRPAGFEPCRVGAEQHGKIEPGNGIGAGDMQRPRDRQLEQLDERVCEIAADAGKQKLAGAAERRELVDDCQGASAKWHPMLAACFHP